MRRLKIALVASMLVATVLLLGELNRAGVAVVEGSSARSKKQELKSILSPIWGITIHQWSDQIELEARTNGLDPDFIAAVIHAESNGNQLAVSRAGAVGLMGVMPAGPGLEWRPDPEILKDPGINLSWGVAILVEIIRQSGGDISSALAAYSGGWDQANSRVPREYARGVLDDYARAVVVRSNGSPEIASDWTIATEIKRGHIPLESPILSDQPLSGLRKYGEHVVFNYQDNSGRAYYVTGFAAPLALVVPLESPANPLGSDTVDRHLMARLGVAESKVGNSNPRVLQACLPSLTRLRGKLATRWFAPSGCPSWHR